MKSILLIIAIFVATPSFASSKAANEITGKVWREACERKKKEQSFNWETTYECCKKKKDECDSSANNEQQLKDCTEKMNSCVSEKHKFKS